MNEWRDIASAPRDGTPILAYPCTYSSWESSPHEIDVVSWREKGWYLSVDDGVHSVAYELTHWQPLPEPPVRKELNDV